jgi:hypothetical protein
LFDAFAFDRSLFRTAASLPMLCRRIALPR